MVITTGRPAIAAGALAVIALAGASGTALASGAGVASGLASGAGAGAAGSAAGSGTAVPGWRIVSTDHRPGLVLELAATSLGPRNVWVGGNVATAHTDVGRPVAEHWNGRRWSTSNLPAGLSGAIEVLRASAWNNVWAFGETDHGDNGFALRWNGHRWLVMKRWRGFTSIAGAAVLSPADVWVFSAIIGGNPVQHYDGHSWQHVDTHTSIQSLDSVATAPNGDIWAIGTAGGTAVLHGTRTGSGYTWQLTPLSMFDSGNGGEDIYAPSSTDVWAFGGGVRTVGGHDHWFPLAAHLSGQAWHKVSVGGRFTLAGGVSASDGHGGVWVTTGWDSTGVPPHLLHFNGATFAAVHLPPRGGRYVGVFGLATVPGSATVWSAGALTGLGATGANTGVILKYGR
ncbi:MAG TPA: hypothetical protein VN840_21740 [Streptosporangiaceae bacterium]|nr:hypothetical protein [Streptosporangiaceae bacterium]